MTAHTESCLFFALLPGEGVSAQAEAVVDDLRAAQTVKGRWLSPRRYHVTLYFIGDNVEPLVETSILKAAMAIEAPPFTLWLDQVGSFPRNRDIPVWLGPSNLPDELAYLHDEVRRQFGVRSRSRVITFNPHLTIMREATKPLSARPIAPIEWRIKEFVLIRSVFGPKAHYNVLRSYPLRGKSVPPSPQQFDLLGNG